jgi:hypothetical protein
MIDKSIWLKPQLSDDRVSYSLDGLGENERGHIAQKEDQAWKVFAPASGSYVSHFTEEYLIDRLIRLLNSW